MVQEYPSAARKHKLDGTEIYTSCKERNTRIQENMTTARQYTLDSIGNQSVLTVSCRGSKVDTRIHFSSGIKWSFSHLLNCKMEYLLQISEVFVSELIIHDTITKQSCLDAPLLICKA